MAAHAPQMNANFIAIGRTHTIPQADRASRAFRVHMNAQNSGETLQCAKSDHFPRTLRRFFRRLKNAAHRNGPGKSVSLPQLL